MSSRCGRNRRGRSNPAGTRCGARPVSPELALVDPKLRQAARELLPDPPRPVPVARPPVEPTPPRILAPVPELAPPRRRSRLGLLASAAGVLALGVLLTLVVGREERDSPDGRRRLNRSQPPSHQRPLRSRSQSPLRPRLPAPRRRRRPPRPFTRPRFGGRRSSGSLPRTRRHTSSICSRAASASSGRASTKRDSSFRVAGGWQAALTRCCRGATAGTSGRSPRAQIASRRSRR